MLSIEDRIGISTHFIPATHGEDIFDAIRLVHDAGFRGFEVVPTLDQANIGYPENYPNVGGDLWETSAAELIRLKDALSVFDWVTVHGPHLDWNLASANRHLRRSTWEYYDRCFEWAVEIGAAAMTYHMGGGTFGYIRSPQWARRYNQEFAVHIMERARATDMPVGFEAGGLADLKYFCDRIDGWGINLDIGHAYMAAGTDEGFFEYIEQLGDRIVEVHHNGVNHYWGGYMEHQAPHLNNMIDFQGVYERLREIDYQGPIVCEVEGHDLEQYIAHCQESKDMIVEIWNGTRLLKERWNVPT